MEIPDPIENHFVRFHTELVTVAYTENDVDNLWQEI